MFITVVAYGQDTAIPKNEITLKKAILTAYKNNKDIQSQEQQIDVAKAGIVGATGRFLPTINAEAAYTHNKKVLAENIFSGYPRDHMAALSATEMIYDGGANIVNYNQAQINLRIAQETVRAKKLDVEFDAKSLYYGLLLAYETARIAKEAVEQAQAHYENVAKKYEQGTSSKFDTLQSKVQVSLLMPELVQANNEAKLVKAQLNKLLGSRIDEPVEPTEKLDYSITEIKEAEFLNTAYKNKPEMMLQALNVDLSKWSIEMAKSGAGPNISMDGEYYYRSDKTSDMFNDSHKNWYWGASVSIPIFDGFSTMSKINEARALYAKAKIDKDNLTDQIAVDIRQACLNLTEALQLINSQKDNIEEAHEALKIAEVSYDNGVGTNLDVLDAQVALAQIQTNLASGIYDYLMAQAQLDRTMGKSYITEDKNDKR